MICKYILLITFLNQPKLILLHIVKWFHVFLSQAVLFDPQIGLHQVLQLRNRGDLGAMTMKKYSAFPQSSSITEASPPDGSMLHPGHSLVGSYASAEIQSVYSTPRLDYLLWGKVGLQPFVYFHGVFCLCTALHNRSMKNKKICRHTSGGISSSTTSNSSFANFHSLMSSWQLIFLVGFKRGSEQILKMLFPLLKSFFVADSF